VRKNTRKAGAPLKKKQGKKLRENRQPYRDLWFLRQEGNGLPRWSRGWDILWRVAKKSKKNGGAMSGGKKNGAGTNN